jgi:hypothetical protein
VTAATEAATVVEAVDAKRAATAATALTSATDAATVVEAVDAKAAATAATAAAAGELRLIPAGNDILNFQSATCFCSLNVVHKRTKM